MILYSEKDDHYSHRVRIVLAEKDIACEIRETSNEEAPDEVLALNPYHCLPILSDRDLGPVLHFLQSTRNGDHADWQFGGFDDRSGGEIGQDHERSAEQD